MHTLAYENSCKKYLNILEAYEPWFNIIIESY